MLVCTDCHHPLEAFDPLPPFRGVTKPQAQRVQEYVVKYAQLLGSPNVPAVKVRDNLESQWLGRTSFTTKNMGTTSMEIQKRILDDPKTLERVIAHEMVHHVEMITWTDAQIAGLRRGITPPPHAERFQELAKQVNDAVGDPAFVTEKSDESYAEAPTKAFYVLIAEVVEPRDGSHTYIYGYALKLTPKVLKYVEPRVAKNGARLVQTRDRRWLRGQRIGAGWAVPPSDEDQERLRVMYEGSPA